MQDWPKTLQEAQEVQQQLRGQVIARDELGPVRLIAGVDAGYEGEEAKAAVVLLAYPSLEPVEYTMARRPVLFPYVPGFLSFRETPAVMAALAQLKARPDLILCDGQGIAHPRRFGIACHIGVLSGLPTVGCAKSILVGRHDPLPDVRGAQVPLLHKGEPIGVALRTREKVKPLYISIGHKISLPTALEYVMSCVTKYRLPEPTRAADALASHGKLPLIAAKKGQRDLFGES
jgi:deoxyribonuclease V